MKPSSHSSASKGTKAMQFPEADRDGDGLISPEEFYRVMRKQRSKKPAIRV